MYPAGLPNLSGSSSCWLSYEISAGVEGLSVSCKAKLQPQPPQLQRRTARAHAAAQGWQTQLLSGGCTCLLQISKSRRSSRAAGRHRALRRQLGQERLLHKYTRPFAAPSRQKQSLRQRRLHLCPAQRKNFFSRWTAGPFQADGAVRTGLGDGANGRADHTCNASGHCAGPWDTIVLAMALVVLLERHRS